MPSLFFFPLESSQTLRLLGIYAYLYITSHTIHHSTSFDVWHTLCMLAMMYLTVVHLVEYSPIEDESLCMGSNLYWHLYENGWGRKYICMWCFCTVLVRNSIHSYDGRVMDLCWMMMCFVIFCICIFVWYKFVALHIFTSISIISLYLCMFINVPYVCFHSFHASSYACVFHSYWHVT